MDNYEEKKLVSANWLSLLGFFVGARLGYGFYHWGIWNGSYFDWFSFFSKPGMLDGAGYLGFLLMAGLISKINNWKYWSFLEDGIGPFLWFLVFWRMGEAELSFTWILGQLLLLLTLVACWFFAKRYRSFWWYKSGKKGFIFLMANLIFSLGFLPMMLLFKCDQFLVFLTLTMVLLSVVGLFILGEVFKKV